MCRKSLHLLPEDECKHNVVPVHSSPLHLTYTLWQAHGRKKLCPEYHGPHQGIATKPSATLGLQGPKAQTPNGSTICTPHGPVSTATMGETPSFFVARGLTEGASASLPRVCLTKDGLVPCPGLTDQITAVCMLCLTPMSTP